MIPLLKCNLTTKKTNFDFSFVSVSSHTFIFFLPKKEKERYNYTCLSYLKEVLL